MKRALTCMVAAFVAFLIFSPTVHGQTISAASCSLTDVQTALNAVQSTTTLLVIPPCGAGGTVWNGQATLSVPSGNTSLTIQGGTVCTPSGMPGQSNYSIACNDISEIVDGDTNGSNTILAISNVTGYLRVTGLTIANNSSAAAKNNGTVSIGGNSTQVRIDHNHIIDVTGDGHMVQIGGCTSGVADHNLSESPVGNGSENTFRIYNAGSCYNDALGVGDQSWAHATQLGSANFFFLENNVFKNGASDDCSQGGRMVVRYNSYSETGPAPAIQTHATGASARWRGCRAWEIYNNYFYPGDTKGEQPALYMTAGTGVIYNNNAAGVSGSQGFKGLVVTHNSRVGVDYGETDTPNGWGYCGTAKDGIGSNWDQDSNATTGYRCIDQVGAGQSDLIVNDFPNMTNQTTGCAAATWTPSPTCARFNNAVEPVYSWGNIWTNSLKWGGLQEWSNADAGTEVQNSDYFLWCDPASTSGCTSAFNGTQGVGSGPLSARPATCTPGAGTNVPGVGYWATDQNTLYVCENNGSSNLWVSYYSPYEYPHPLDTGNLVSGGPAAPTGLQALVQ
jgi:hypothetical protein